MSYIRPCLAMTCPACTNPFRQSRTDIKGICNNVHETWYVKPLQTLSVCMLGRTDLQACKMQHKTRRASLRKHLNFRLRYARIEQSRCAHQNCYTMFSFVSIPSSTHNTPTIPSSPFNGHVTLQFFHKNKAPRKQTNLHVMPLSSPCSSVF